jgi:N-methylhydantoinase A
VTDANVVLGTLDREHLLAGALPIDAGAAHAAVTRLGESLSLSPADVAEGILRIVSSNMEKAIRLISVARGYDPRDFTLVAFGGAGPLHAARLARDLNIPRVLVPRYPGVLCAMGLLLSDIMTTFTLTHFAEATLAAMPSFLAAAERLVALSEDWFDGQGIAPGDRATKLFADARYRGQGHELTVELPFEMDPSRLLETLRTQFEAAHERAFRYRISGAPIQTTALRIEATAHIRKAKMEEAPPAQQPVAAARSGSRQVYSAAERGWRDVPLYDRARLGPGHAIEGPAIVEQFDATIVILADQSARVDGYLNIIIESTG